MGFVVVFHFFLRLFFRVLHLYIVGLILLYLWMMRRLIVYRRLSENANHEWLNHT